MLPSASSHKPCQWVNPFSAAGSASRGTLLPILPSPHPLPEPHARRNRGPTVAAEPPSALVLSRYPEKHSILINLYKGRGATE